MLGPDGADDDLNAKIKSVFQKFPESFWVANKEKLKETQWKKLEKLMAA